MSGWQGRRVLVTGAGGFIGSHVCEALVTAGATTRALVHYSSSGSWHNLTHLSGEILREIEVVAGDIQDPQSVRAAVRGTSVVMHLAALIAIPYSYCAPHSYMSTNVNGTLNVLQAARDEAIERVVQTSTSEVYGTARYTPIDEDHPLCAQSPYAASKIAADKLAESFHLSFGLPVATIRPFNTFGPRQSARAIIPTIISQLLATGGRASLGALDPARDFTFVEDTAQAFLAVADASGTVGKVTNVGTGRSISVGELAALAGEVLGIERIEIAQDPGRLRPANSEVMRLECNAGRLFERCGWKPGVDLKTGLRRTAEFIRAQPRLYRPETYTV